jgi:methionyl aminopeptidase
MGKISIKSKAEIVLLEKGGQIHAQILQELIREAQVGVTTKELDRLTHKLCQKNQVKPSFFGFYGFPGAICISVNEEIVHGIPSERKLVAGDLVSIDLGVNYADFHTDGCVSFIVGTTNSPKAKKLIKTTKSCLNKAIDEVRAGNFLGNVSNVIEKTASKGGFKIVPNLTGHGIGRQLHEEPQILNYGQKGTGIRLKEGMVLAIEPILTAGSPLNTTLSDGWTVVTEDNSLAAHFEHTIVVTKKEPLVVTKWS